MTDIVDDYLRELDSVAGAWLTPTRRHELVSDIREHIDSAVHAGEPPGAVMSRLGTPNEIVGAEPPEARLPQQHPAQGPRLRNEEIAALILLQVGAILFLIGWVFGLALLWNSNRWTTRDKWIGTFLVPGGISASLMFGITTLWSGGSETCIDNVCTTEGTAVDQWLGVTLGILLIVIPIATTIHLYRSAKAPR